MTSLDSTFVGGFSMPPSGRSLAHCYPAGVLSYGVLP